VSDTSYTHTTISAGPDEPTRIGVSFYLDQQSVIGLTGAGTDRPFLSVMHGDVWVRISPRTEGVTEADAQIARKLADSALQYAAEVERLAQQTTAENAAAA
jgi:hypothetical protein